MPTVGEWIDLSRIVSSTTGDGEAELAGIVGLEHSDLQAEQQHAHTQQGGEGEPRGGVSYEGQAVAAVTTEVCRLSPAGGATPARPSGRHARSAADEPAELLGVPGIDHQRPLRTLAQQTAAQLGRATRPRRCHAVQIPRREAAHVRELSTQITGKPGDHPCAPALARLPVQDRFPDRPIELEQCGC